MEKVNEEQRDAQTQKITDEMIEKMSDSVIGKNLLTMIWNRLSDARVIGDKCYIATQDGKVISMLFTDAGDEKRALKQINSLAQIELESIQAKAREDTDKAREARSE